MIPISAVDIDRETEDLVMGVLRSGQLAQGPMVERLEGEFRRLSGTAHAVAVNSGTTALVASLQALGIGPGDEVITSPFTFVATVNAIIEAGATVRFADIGADDFLIGPDAIEAQVTPKTAALLPVHLYGLPVDMPAVCKLASSRGLAVVEDAAQAHGARVNQRPVGSYGLGCFSFYATKNITTGEGGLVTTDDAALASRLRLLRNQGMGSRYDYRIVGHNYRLTDLQAAVGVGQLRRLPEKTKRRVDNAARLIEALYDLPGLVVPRVVPGREHVFHQFTVRVTRDARLQRDDLAQVLRHRGIATGVYYPRAVYDYPAYREHALVLAQECPEAEKASREVLSLPIHPSLQSDEIETIAREMRRALHG